jgi:hypothetical protein
LIGDGGLRIAPFDWRLPQWDIQRWTESRFVEWSDPLNRQIAIHRIRYRQAQTSIE